MATLQAAPISLPVHSSLAARGGSLAPSRSIAQAPVFFAAGTEIYAQGERCSGLYKIEFGAVRVYRLLSDGRRQISAFHLAGETFGFEADNVHHFFAEAICATGLHVVQASPANNLSSELFPLALKSLVRAQEHLLVLGRQNAIERIAAFLADMAERQGGLKQVDLPMSRADIGDYLGLTIETVSRVFSKLKQKGVIRLPSLRCVEIAKWQVLQDLAA
ncbi:MAG: helix-turn-helix domain-containing protein [Mesorhizobium sp.]|nr:helix-turn-helix domain-containing protein [Mesorhizobium sp.]MCO5160137.1 helix-turn-helix domain-containing protein [Mesorhizobium sp.]